MHKEIRGSSDYTEICLSQQDKAELGRRKRHSGLNIAGFAAATLFAVGIIAGLPNVTNAQSRGVKCPVILEAQVLPKGGARVVAYDGETNELVVSQVMRAGDQVLAYPFSTEGRVFRRLVVSVDGMPDDYATINGRCLPDEGKPDQVHRLDFGDSGNWKVSTGPFVPQIPKSPYVQPEPTPAPPIEEAVSGNNILNIPPDALKNKWGVGVGMIIGLWGLRKIIQRFIRRPIDLHIPGCGFRRLI